MEIKQFLDEKKDMEYSIAVYISAAIETFRRGTGYSPSVIDVSMYEVTPVGRERRIWKVGKVTAEVEL